MEGGAREGKEWKEEGRRGEGRGGGRVGDHTLIEIKSSYVEWGARAVVVVGGERGDEEGGAIVLHDEGEGVGNACAELVVGVIHHWSCTLT